MRKNPFGEDASRPRRENPFGDGEAQLTNAEAAMRIEHSARKIRDLRRQLGTEGLSIPATRELIDEIATALELAARAIRQTSTG